MGASLRGIATASLALSILLGSGCSGGEEPSEPELVVRSIGPNSILPNIGPVTVVINGAGFQSGAVAELDNKVLETTFSSESRIFAKLAFEDVAQPDTFTIRVRNRDGAVSNGVTFFVSADADPFHYDSVTPASDAEVNADTSIAIYLSEALDSASIVDTSVAVRDESGSVVSGTIAYDDDAHALRWTGTLGQAHRYTVTLSDELRTPSGGGLSGSLHWSFTTTLGVTVLLDTTGTWPVMLLGANGLPSVAYKGLERFRLSVCASGCDTRAAWSTFNVGQLAAPDFLSAVTGAGGTIHYGFQDPATESAMYATATGQAVVIESNAAYTSIGVAPSGRLHMLYYRTGDLHEATCASNCTTGANWQINVVDTAGNAGSFTSVAVDAQGGVHVLYYENDSADLRYAVCDAPCTTPTWTTGPVDTAGNVGSGSSLLVDATGALHATWLNPGTEDLIYGICTTACTTVEGWSTSIVEHVGPPLGYDYPSLALGANGLELSYFETIIGRLRGATCALACTGPGAWTTFTVSLAATSSSADHLTRLRIDSEGRRNVAWIDAHNGVRYTRY